MTATYQAMCGILTVIAAICVYAAATYPTRRRRADSLTDHRAVVRGVYDQDQP